MRGVLVTCLTVLAVGACRPARPAPEPAAALAPAGAVRHVVVFRFKPGATPEQIRTLTEAFGALRQQIPGIIGFEHGVNDSPERQNLGFTHVYLLTFANAAARDAYLPHPAHKAFGELLGRLGIYDGVFVVDYAPAP
jgi:hypothetical protein